MKKRYSGFNNAFSIIESGMCKLGIWPLRKDDVLFSNIRWCFVITVNLIIAINVLMEICMSCGDASNTLESFLVLDISIHGICNCLFPKIYRKKLAKNINSAIEDWSVMENEESREIMRFYARTSRFIGMGQLILCGIGYILYFSSILIIQTYHTDAKSNGTVTRRYVIPVKCFFETVSNTKYKIIILVQMFQSLNLLATMWTVDNFFFTTVLHLCGQLDVLKKRFSKFIEKESSTKKHNWKEFSVFVERHCHLINLADNLEDTFNFPIMIQLLMDTILIALTGFRLILSAKNNKNVEIAKSLIFLICTIVQSFLYTCAGDLLGGQSEDMFHTLWQTSWYHFPPTMIRNFAFVMRRSKQPLRITAGKFLYISRITLMDIIKAAVSYISFLQITMQT